MELKDWTFSTTSYVLCTAYADETTVFLKYKNSVFETWVSFH